MQPRIAAIPVGTYQNPTTPQGHEDLIIGEIGLADPCASRAADFASGPWTS